MRNDGTGVLYNCARHYAQNLFGRVLKRNIFKTALYFGPLILYYRPKSGSILVESLVENGNEQQVGFISFGGRLS
jgi:hypothetical protein